MKRIGYVLCLLGIAATAFAQSPAANVVLDDVTIVDVASGRLQPGQRVWIQGDRIAGIAANGALAVPGGAQLVKATGKFLIPGLWDMHTHVADETYCQLFLANGVTGVREMHAFFPPLLLGLRDPAPHVQEDGHVAAVEHREREHDAEAAERAQSDEGETEPERIDTGAHAQVAGHATDDRSVVDGRRRGTARHGAPRRGRWPGLGIHR